MPVTNYLWDVVSDCVLEETDGSNNVQVAYTNEPSRYGPFGLPLMVVPVVMRVPLGC